jgi:TRAP-type C4-dicarboxylate transport system substrate-binding protein
LFKSARTSYSREDDLTEWDMKLVGRVYEAAPGILDVSSLRCGSFATAFAAALAITAASWVSPAAAQDVITLKFAHTLPATNYNWERAGKVFTEAVTAATNGRVQFEVYPAGQLGKDVITTLQSGLADVGLIVPSFSAEKLPLSSVTELPGMYSTACEATGMIQQVLGDGGMLRTAEYEPLGLRPLFGATLIPYMVLTSSVEVTRLEDLQGLKLRANGAAMDKTIRSLGGVPVRAPGPELYDAISRGIVDGVFFTLNGLPQYTLEKVLNYGSRGPKIGSASVVYAVSDNSWEKLPDDVKAAIEEASDQTAKSFCTWMEEDERRMTTELAASGEIVIRELPPEEIARWAERTAPLADEWASEMDSAGLKGSDMLEAYRSTRIGQ